MNCALIVVDCQNDFIRDRSPYACQMLDEALLQRIQRLLEGCRATKLPIVFTQHSIRPDKSNAEPFEPADVRACIIGTPGWEIIDVLKPHAGEPVMQKDKFDAFYQTPLEAMLREAKCDTVVLCGVLTNNCIRSTAEGAYFRGFQLRLISDACGATSFLPDYTAQQIHDLTLRELAERTYGTELLTVDEFLSSIK